MSVLQAQYGARRVLSLFDQRQRAVRVMAGSSAEMRSRRKPKRGHRGAVRTLAALATLLCAVLALALPAAAGATPAWLAPVNVVEGLPEYPSASVAMDAHGDAATAWTACSFEQSIHAGCGGRAGVEESFRAAGGSWSPAAALSEPGLFGYERIKLAFDARGDAFAVFGVYTYAGTSAVPPEGEAVQVAFKPAGGSWKKAVTISQGCELRGWWTEPNLAVNREGDAVAAWRCHSGGSERVALQSAYMPAGGSWQKPITLAERPYEFGEMTYSSPEVGIDAHGNVTAAWSQQWPASSEALWTAYRPAGGSWEAPVVVSSGETGGPSLAVAGAGEATLAFRPENEGKVLTISKVPGGTWQPPVVLNPSDEEVPELGADEAGDLVAVWTSTPVLRGDFRPAGGSWQAPVVVAEGQPEQQSLAVTPGGKAMVVFRPLVPSTHIAAAVRPIAGPWQAPVELGGAGEWGVSDPKAAVDARGDGVAVWNESTGIETPSIVQAAGYEAAGPLLEGLSIPHSATAGEPAYFSVSPLAVWSTLGETRWSFGDGSSATGTSVTHTYANPGTYTVTVTSEDAFGNTTSESQSITVAPGVINVEFKNWLLAGALTPKRLAQAITLPPGSTFNGSAKLDTGSGAGSVAGNISIPPFTAALKLFGLIPAGLGITLSEAAPLSGTFTESESGDERLSIPLALKMRITSVSLLGLSIPTSCETKEPLSLGLADTLTREDLLTKGWSFAGNTTLPAIRCEGGFLGTLFGPILSALISGPENPYSLSFTAPEA